MTHKDGKTTLERTADPVTWNEAAVLDFWRFVCERHRLFLRRFVWRTPLPWTSDRILSTLFTTNVYRELDRGTRFLLRHILSFAPTSPPEHVLFNVAAYRMFGLPETWLALGGFEGIVAWWWRRADAVLAERHRQGEQLFTGAYRASQRGMPCGPGEKYKVVVTKLTKVYVQLPTVTLALLAAPSMEEAHALLNNMPGLGGDSGFLAYEVLSDLILNQAVLKFSEDDWVNPGPGALEGLQVLAPETRFTPGNRVTRERARTAIAELRWRQDEWLTKAGVALLGPALTLRNVEHSLCEYSKYVRARDNGHAKRRFRPEAASQDLSLWDDLPPQFVVPRRTPLRPTIMAG